jgi:hypothetical protein
MYSTAQIEAVQVLFQEKYEESVNWRRTEEKSTKGQTTIYKTLHRIGIIIAREEILHLRGESHE